MADIEEQTVFIPHDALTELAPPMPIQSQSPPLSYPNGNEHVWSTIHEDYQPSQQQVIFPPINHEGIQHKQIDTEQTSHHSPVSTPRSRPPEMGEFITFRWWDVGLYVLRVKFVNIVSFLQSFSINRRSNFSLAGSIVVLLLLYLRFRPRRRLRKKSIIELIHIIKEKDEKIHGLMYQIARMNELLLATHHGVPLISKPASV